MSDPFRNLTNLYARAIDRGDIEALCVIFTEDGRIHGPGFSFKGRKGFSQMFASLAKNFKVTQHRFFNQIIDVDVDIASGETYALACHIIEAEDGSWQNHEWAIRYQDQFQKQDGDWKFKSRELVVDWVQTTPATPLKLGD